MPFTDLPGYEYTEPIAFWEPEVEVVEAGHSSGFDTSIEPSGPSSVLRTTPFSFDGGTVADARYRRAPGGEYPQENGGLSYAWNIARYGRAESELWPDRGTTITSGTIGGALHKGARYHLDSAAGPNPFDAGAQVAAESGTGAFSLHPGNALFDSWFNHLFSTSSHSEPDISDAYDEVTNNDRPPGDGWLPFIEFPWPIFLRYQYAVDEVVPGSSLYAGTGNPTGTVYVGARAVGLGLADKDPDGVRTWVGPGSYATPHLYTYAGGAGAWLDPPANTYPGQSLSTGRLTPGTVPWLILNTYIEYQSMLAGTVIVPDLLSAPPPDGYSVHLGAERSQLTFAARSFWRAPLLRWGREATTVVRQYPRDDARGVSSAPRLWPPSKSRRLAGGYPGGSGA